MNNRRCVGWPAAKPFTVRRRRSRLGEGQSLVPEIRDDLKPSAEGLDVSGDSAQRGGARLAFSIAETRPWVTTTRAAA